MTSLHLCLMFQSVFVFSFIPTELRACAGYKFPAIMNVNESVLAMMVEGMTAIVPVGELVVAMEEDNGNGSGCGAGDGVGGVVIVVIEGGHSGKATKQYCL